MMTEKTGHVPSHHFDPVQDGRREDVDASVDLVRHELSWFFQVSFDQTSGLVIDDHTILAGLVHFGDLSRDHELDQVFDIHIFSSLTSIVPCLP